MKDVLCEIEVLQWKWLVCRGIEQFPWVDRLRRDAAIDADVSLHTNHAWTIEHRLTTIITKPE